MGIRDLLTIVALLLVLLLAGSARSAEPTDILSILSSEDPVVKNVLGDLGDVDRAADRLRATRAAAEAASTRAAGEQSTLGIGALGGPTEREALARLDFLPDRDRVRAEAIIARATDEIGACYGEPMRDANSRYDFLTVRVVVDGTGAVTAVTILESTRFGQRDTDACVTSALGQVRFPAGMTETVAQVGYRWTFDLGASTAIRFADR